MKVQNINNIPLETITKLESESSAHSSELVFKSALTNESEHVYMRQIEGLVRTIEEQGKRIKERADMSELQKYRENITKLINETVSNGFAFHKEGKLGPNGRSKIFAMIKTVNEKLDSLTKKILSEEKDNISLLDEVDDIRGLLVDMYL